MSKFNPFPDRCSQLDSSAAPRGLTGILLAVTIWNAAFPWSTRSIILLLTASAVACSSTRAEVVVLHPVAETTLFQTEPSNNVWLLILILYSRTRDRIARAKPTFYVSR